MVDIAIGFLLLVIMLIIGVPVMYCFGAALIYCSLTLGYTPTMIFPTIYGKLSSVVLLSIPLFILAGKIMEHGKIGDALINFIEMLVGKIKGSLAIMTSVACAVFRSDMRKRHGHIILHRLDNDSENEREKISA